MALIPPLEARPNGYSVSSKSTPLTPDLGFGSLVGLLLHANRISSSERNPGPILGAVRREELYSQLLILASAEQETVPTVTVLLTRARF